MKNCVSQTYGVENIELVANERRSFNILLEMVLFPKIYVKIYLFHGNEFMSGWMKCTKLFIEPRKGFSGSMNCTNWW